MENEDSDSSEVKDPSFVMKGGKSVPRETPNKKRPIKREVSEEFDPMFLASISSSAMTTNEILLKMLTEIRELQKDTLMIRDFSAAILQNSYVGSCTLSEKLHPLFLSMWQVMQKGKDGPAVVVPPKVAAANTTEVVSYIPFREEYRREDFGPGATLFSNGRGTNFELPRSMVKMPDAGGSLVTTLDLDVQSVAVMKLREAVARTGSKSGTAVFVDPKTGDILAMATVDGPTAGGARFLRSSSRRRSRQRGRRRRRRRDDGPTRYRQYAANTRSGRPMAVGLGDGRRSRRREALAACGRHRGRDARLGLLDPKDARGRLVRAYRGTFPG